MTTKRYDILNSLPPYGPMHVSITSSGAPFYSEGFVVRFYKTDGTEWVANFQPGYTDLKEVIEFEGIQNLFVIACGTCYVMNPNDTKPFEVFGDNFSDIFEANKGRIVLPDQTGLTILEPDGKYWDTERISWDGLVEIKVENNLISGLAYNPMHEEDEWVEFKYNLDTKTLTGGSYYSFEKKKPWWKIW